MENDLDMLFIDSKPDERKNIILTAVSEMVDEVENENKEICGYVSFIFYPDDKIGTVMSWEGVLNPTHILEALEAQGIIQKVKV